MPRGDDDQRTAYLGLELDQESQLGDHGVRKVDYELGRFTTIDPLWEKYYAWTPYHYSYNNPISFADWNGLDPGDLFSSEIAAALDFAMYYNGTSIAINREFASSMYVYSEEGKFSYNIAYIGSAYTTSHNLVIPDGTYIVGLLHTHGAYDSEYKNDEFSSGDIFSVGETGLDSYLVTPSGKLLFYDSIVGASSNLLDASINNIPSDPNSPERVNEITATNTKAVYSEVNLDNVLPSINKPKNQFFF